MQFQIVRTANLTGYRWTIFLDGNKTRSGRCYTAEDAIHEVKRAVAKFFSEEKGVRTPAQRNLAIHRHD